MHTHTLQRRDPVKEEMVEHENMLIYEAFYHITLQQHLLPPRRSPSQLSSLLGVEGAASRSNSTTVVKAVPDVKSAHDTVRLAAVNLPASPDCMLERADFSPRGADVVSAGLGKLTAPLPNWGSCCCTNCGSRVLNGLRGGRFTPADGGYELERV